MEHHKFIEFESQPQTLTFRTKSTHKFSGDVRAQEKMYSNNFSFSYYYLERIQHVEFTVKAIIDIYPINK